MNERTLHVLEFHKIIKKLTSHVATSIGRDIALQLKPSIEITEVQRTQLETDEAAQVLRLDKDIPLGGIVDIRTSLQRSNIGGMLSTKECLDISTTIYGGRQTKDFIEDLEEDLPILKEFASQITSLRHLEVQINSCIDDNGHVIDSASTKLRGIRSSIRTYESRIREKLESYIRTKSKHLSDAIITIRNDRYVLPVKHEHRASIGGIVHDQSASGQTLFMEPRALVDLNNQLQEELLKEQQEIEHILRELSTAIAENQSYLFDNVKVLAQIDFITAKAKLGKEMKAAMPKVNDYGYINIKQARHPLIPNDEVVANDIEIGDTYTSILITGPNTGGKTVILKLIGLCTLMAQSGLQIPAFDGCEIAVFERIYADIGDEQSIEQSLSTFSSHMTNIVNIIDHVDSKSLVLFDELGSGTDPQEGASLAMSILDEVISRDARVIATTHYPELKAYGYNRENVINASVEFNVETLKPTYRLLIGVPGRSNAFDISKRLGLSETIIQRAKDHIGVDSKGIENMIVSLEHSQKEAEKDYEEAHQNLLASEKLREELAKEWKEFEHQREKLYHKAEEKAQKALQDARDGATLIVDEIRGMKTGAEFKEHEWIEAKKMLEDANPSLSTKQTISNKGISKEIKKGDQVKLLTINQIGTVLEKINKKEYTVQVGMMRVNVKSKDLQFIESEEPKEEKPVTMIRSVTSHVKTELDLRGERYEEAMSRLDNYIDDVLLAGHSRVLIIHGKGTGALRKGVQELAKRYPQITTVKFGTQSEGGDGVTVLELT